jgi:large subunit ribosomal protein L22
VNKEEKKTVMASYKNANSSPQKMGLVADLIRGMDAKKAQEILRFTRKKAAGTMLKLLNSAVANAENNFDLKLENLKVSRIEVGDGLKLPRIRFSSRGRVSRLSKRRSMIKIELIEK